MAQINASAMLARGAAANRRLNRKVSRLLPDNPLGRGMPAEIDRARSASEIFGTSVSPRGPRIDPVAIGEFNPFTEGRPLNLGASDITDAAGASNLFTFTERLPLALKEAPVEAILPESDGRREFFNALYDSVLRSRGIIDPSGVGEGNKFGISQFGQIAGQVGAALLAGHPTLGGLAEVGLAASEQNRLSTLSKATSDIASGIPLEQINFSGLTPDEVQSVLDTNDRQEARQFEKIGMQLDLFEKIERVRNIGENTLQDQETQAKIDEIYARINHLMGTEEREKRVATHAQQEKVNTAKVMRELGLDREVQGDYEDKQFQSHMQKALVFTGLGRINSLGMLIMSPEISALSTAEKINKIRAYFSNYAPEYLDRIKAATMPETKSEEPSEEQRKSRVKDFTKGLLKEESP